MSDAEQDRAKMIAAIEAGRVEFAPGVEELVEAIDLRNPDFTITSARVVGSLRDPYKGFWVEWTTVSAGFGSLVFEVKDGKLTCQNECMGRAFIKSVFDHIIDNCELMEE